MRYNMSVCVVQCSINKQTMQPITNRVHTIDEHCIDEVAAAAAAKATTIAYTLTLHTHTQIICNNNIDESEPLTHKQSESLLSELCCQ